ncbi:MAG: DUF2142 domain-containing protein [Nitrospirae bacterium YQR-1]
MDIKKAFSYHGNETPALLKKPELFFVFFAFFAGLLMLFITPPFQTPDEYNHFYRTYQISEGGWIAEKKEGKVGGFLPQALLVTAQTVSKNIPFHVENHQKVEDIFAVASLPLNKHIRVFIEFYNTARYSPLPYLPQALGVALGGLFHPSPIKLFYLGRMFNLFFWLALCYLSIKTVPVFKWVFTLLALTPISLFIGASLSPDAFTNGISFLFISTVIRFAYGDDVKSGSAYIAVIFIISVILSLSKQGYFFLFFLFFLIPVNKIALRGNTVLKYSITFLCLIALAVISSAAWHFLIRDFAMATITSDGGYDVSLAKAKIFFVLHSPLQYLKMLGLTYSSCFNGYMIQLIGKLGWTDTYLPKLLIYSYYLTLILTALTEQTHNNIKINAAHKTLMGMISILTIVLITTLMFITWTPPEEKIIYDIQGRYFIPLTPLIFFMFYDSFLSKKHLRYKNTVFNRHIRLINYFRNNTYTARAILFVYCVYSTTATLITLVNRYYG